MNLLTLIGAATVCEDFCQLLAKDPVKAAELLGLFLTNLELEQLKSTFKGKNGAKLCEQLDGVRAYFCRQPPCPYAPVLAGLKDLCNKAA